MTNLEQLPIVVIGAGPVGLAAAAHLQTRGLEDDVQLVLPETGVCVTDFEPETESSEPAGCCATPEAPVVSSSLRKNKGGCCG